MARKREVPDRGSSAPRKTGGPCPLPAGRRATPPANLSNGHSPVMLCNDVLPSSRRSSVPELLAECEKLKILLSGDDSRLIQWHAPQRMNDIWRSMKEMGGAPVPARPALLLRLDAWHGDIGTVDFSRSVHGTDDEIRSCLESALAWCVNHPARDVPKAKVGGDMGREPAIEPAPEGGWSETMTIPSAARRFKLDIRTLKEAIASGSIRSKRLSPRGRLYMFALADMPKTEH
jgi:hypothetical protein